MTDVVPAAGASREEVLRIAAALEKHSAHPVAAALVAAAVEGNLSLPDTESFESRPGRGVEGVVGGRRSVVGNDTLLRESGVDPSDLREAADRLSAEGKTPIFVAVDGRAIGLITLADREKPSSAGAIAALKARGLRVTMITGDREKTARAVAAQVGVDEVFAEVLPADKALTVRQLQARATWWRWWATASTTLRRSQADVGIAIGAGADVAIEAADVTLGEAVSTRWSRRSSSRARRSAPSGRTSSSRSSTTSSGFRSRRARSTPPPAGSSLP